METAYQDSDGKMKLNCFDGVWLHEGFEKLGGLQKLKAVSNLPYKDGDILICSYPKAGIHWLTNILYMISSTEPIERLSSSTINLLEFDPIEKFESMSTPRILSTHLCFDHLPQEHLRMRGKLFLLLRNAKDTAVSYFHHARKMDPTGAQFTWHQFSQQFFFDKIPFGSYFDYLTSWQQTLDQHKELDLITLYYEDLKKDCLSEMQRIQAFLGLNNSIERLQQIESKCSFENLRVDFETGKTKSKLVDEKGKAFIFRKGKVGEWKNRITVAQNKEFDAVIEEKLKDSVFTFQYQ